MRLILSLDSEIKYTSLVQRKSVIIVTYTLIFICFDMYCEWIQITNDTKRITDPIGYLFTTVLCQFFDILKKFVCIILESTLKVEAFLGLFVSRC